MLRVYMFHHALFIIPWREREIMPFLHDLSSPAEEVADARIFLWTAEIM